MNQVKYANMLNMTELATPENRLFPFDILRRLRNETPVRYDGSRGCWDIFRYDDVQRILKDSKTFSSERGQEPAAPSCSWILRNTSKCAIWSAKHLRQKQFRS